MIYTLPVNKALNVMRTIKIHCQIGTLRLFPFNGSRWLGADVINHAVYATHFVDDVVGHLCHKFVG